MTTPAPRPAGTAVAEVSMTLEDGPAASGSARRLVRSTLRDWQLEPLLDDVLLAVSELVTNAVLHGLPPTALALRRDADRLTVTVTDQRPATAAHAVPLPGTAPEAESGRGRGIVETVSTTSGVESCGDAGKRVYATWDVPPERHDR